MEPAPPKAPFTPSAIFAIAVFVMALGLLLRFGDLRAGQPHRPGPPAARGEVEAGTAGLVGAPEA